MLSYLTSSEWGGRRQDEIFELTRYACPPHLRARLAGEADQPPAQPRLTTTPKNTLIGIRWGKVVSGDKSGDKTPKNNKAPPKGEAKCLICMVPASGIEPETY